eukprot:symbB.v1.2.008617.t1/scaffold516.1/size216213/3
MVRDTSSAFLFEIHSWAKGTSLSPFATQPLHQWPSMGLRGLWKKGFTIRLLESGQLRQGNGKVSLSDGKVLGCPSRRCLQSMYEHVYFIDERGKRVTGKGGVVTHPVAKLGELPQVHDAQLVGVGNVCELVVVDNAAVLHTVRTRYKRTDIYTFARTSETVSYDSKQQLLWAKVSKMLVAVNPFRELAVYSKENLMRYLGASSTIDLPPHIYALGLHAVKGLQQHGGTSQVVLISGESGAGKTESAKLVMSYISEALGSSRNLQRRDSRPRYSISAPDASPGSA